jgi:hypothetical protein
MGFFCLDKKELSGCLLLSFLLISSGIPVILAHCSFLASGVTLLLIWIVYHRGSALGLGASGFV